MTIIHYAEYYEPGLFFMPKTYSRPFEVRDPEVIRDCAGPNVFCFVMYDLEEPHEDVKRAAAEANQKLVPIRQNVSPRHYIGGELFTVEQVEAMGEDILASNMRGNRWDFVIRCRSGNWQPFFTETDVRMGEPV